MKKDIHPQYRPVLFEDISSGYRFVTKSTVKTREVINYEGVEYPLYKVEISSTSHPVYTGQKLNLNVLGGVAKFNSKYKGSKGWWNGSSS